MHEFPDIRGGMASPRRTTPRHTRSKPEITHIGRTFADRRVALRLTQQTLADLAGVSRYSVQSLEQGSGSAKLASVLEIAGVLGLRIDVSTAIE